MHGLGIVSAVCVFAAGLSAGAVAAQPAAPQRQPDPARAPQQVRAADYRAPAGVDFRAVTIISDGIRLHGEVFTPAGTPAGRRLPGVVMAHGWGGTAAGLRNDAADIARAGYFVLTFDYRGWGQSGSPVVLVDPEPPHRPGEAEPFTARVRPLREYINPHEQAEDWFSALDWIMGEPQVDPDRIGIRGSSYSGGHVVHVAAHDPRVKAVVSQVGGFDSRPRPGQEGAGRAVATRMARGEIGYPAPRAQAIPGLTGSPVGRKNERYAPVLSAEKVTAPTLILLAEKEEYGGNPTAEQAFRSLKGPKELRVLPGTTHYAVYSTHRTQVVQAAIDWFDRHLKR